MQRIDLPNAELRYEASFFPAPLADRLFTELLETSAWKDEAITLFGKRVQLPRRTAWHGEPGAEYVYSGLRNVPAPWTPALLEVKSAVEAAVGVVFNGVLLNLYRDGRDSMGWHSDDEPEFGPEPVIASVSFGAVRSFQLKPKEGGDTVSLPLAHGSLLEMAGRTQDCWKHAVPKTAKPVGVRLNATFRRLIL